MHNGLFDNNYNSLGHIHPIVPHLKILTVFYFMASLLLILH